MNDRLLFQIINRFGTPSYVYDGEELALRAKCLKRTVPGIDSVYYSVKANPNPHLIRLFAELGFGAEVASIGELSATAKAGIDPAGVIFVGPSKSRLELEEAVKANVGIIVLESSREYSCLEEICRSLAVRQNVLIRLNITGLRGGVVSMGGRTPFGMDLPSASELGRSMRGEHVNLLGFHCYAGTGILSPADFLGNCVDILNAATTLANDLHLDLGLLDIGGGLGVPTNTNDPEPDWSLMSVALLQHLARFRERHPKARIVLESGRYLVATSGWLAMTVIDVKEVHGERYVLTDAGTGTMALDVRYGHKPLRIVRNLSRHADGSKVHLCGPLCTPTDKLAAAADLGACEPGDILALWPVGAYGLSAAPGFFLSRGFPSEVIYLKGRAALIRGSIEAQRFLDAAPDNLAWENSI